MKIKVIVSVPTNEQEGIEFLIGKEFEIIPYKDYEEEIRIEMKKNKEVGVMFEGCPYTLNKNEYEVIS